MPHQMMMMIEYEWGRDTEAAAVNDEELNKSHSLTAEIEK